jgi:hypothetical protein
LEEALAAKDGWKGPPKQALGGRGMKGNIRNVIGYAIPCSVKNCEIVHQFFPSTLQKMNLTAEDIKWAVTTLILQEKNLTAEDIEWAVSDNKLVDLNIHPVPAQLKRISAYLSMLHHLQYYHEIEMEDLPIFFWAGTKEGKGKKNEKKKERAQQKQSERNEKKKERAQQKQSERSGPTGIF